MAKLQQYERQVSLMADAPQLQTPNLAEKARTADILSGSLDQLSQFAFKKAEAGIQKQAIEYSVANSLTANDLKLASSTGINPIEQALNGGTVWNEALNKLYAQQASTELSNVANKHFEDILRKVDSGKISDPSMIQQELETPLKSYFSVVSKLDAEEAARFYKQNIANGHVYYRSALKTLEDREDARQDEINFDSVVSKVNTFKRALSFEDPAVSLQLYLNSMKSAEAEFVGSKNAAVYKNKIRSEFSTAFYNSISNELIKTYGSGDEVAKAFQSGDLGRYTPIIEGLLPTQRDTLEATVAKDFVRIDRENTAKTTALKTKLTDIEKDILDGEPSNNLQAAIDNVELGAVDITGPNKYVVDAQLQKTKIISKIADNFQNISYDKMQIVIDQWRASGKISGDTIKAAESYKANSEKQSKADFAGYAMKNQGGVSGDIENLLPSIFSRGDLNKGKQEFLRQIATVKSSPNYVRGQQSLLTKEQETRVTNLLTSTENALDVPQQVELATNIIKTFGADSQAVFAQLSPSNPIFAHMGVLAAEGYNEYEGTMYRTLSGQATMKANNVTSATLKTRQSAEAIQLTTALKNHSNDAQNILAAADAYYVAIKGTSLDTYDQALYIQALDAVSGGWISSADQVKRGGISVMNDQFVIVPKDMVTKDVPNYVTNARREDFASAVVLVGMDGQVVLDPDGNPMLGALELLEVAPNNKVGILSQDGQVFSQNDLNTATLRAYGDYFMLINDSGNPFIGINQRPVIIDLGMLRDIYVNQHSFIGDTRKMVGPLDRRVVEGYRMSPEALDASLQNTNSSTLNSGNGKGKPTGRGTVDALSK